MNSLSIFCKSKNIDDLKLENILQKIILLYYSNYCIKKNIGDVKLCQQIIYKLQNNYNIPRDIFKHIFKYISKGDECTDITKDGKNCIRSFRYYNKFNNIQKKDCKDYCMENINKWIDQFYKIPDKLSIVYDNKTYKDLNIINLQFMFMYNNRLQRLYYYPNFKKYLDKFELIDLKVIGTLLNIDDIKSKKNIIEQLKNLKLNSVWIHEYENVRASKNYKDSKNFYSKLGKHLTDEKEIYKVLNNMKLLEISTTLDLKTKRFDNQPIKVIDYNILSGKGYGGNMVYITSQKFN